MTEQPPPIVEYRKKEPEPVEPIRYMFSKFVGGVLAGIAAVFLGGMMMSEIVRNGAGVIAVVAAEFITGIVVTVVSRQGRPFGIGLICAVPIGVTVFFIGCAILLSGANFH